MAKVKYSKLAATDLIGYSQLIAEDKPVAAYEWVEKIEDVCATLAAYPEMGQARESRNHGSCRSFTSGKYVIFFRGIQGGVEIIRIVRGGLDLDNV